LLSLSDGSTSEISGNPRNMTDNKAVAAAYWLIGMMASSASWLFARPR
jgi:hypothetical protein